MAAEQFTVEIAWRLPCAHAPNGHHAFVTTWRPSSKRPRSGEERGTYDLRPIARLDHEEFGRIHGRRNVTESYNAWLKRTLGDHKRAMRLSVREQFLDHLCAGTLANALTWTRHLMQTAPPASRAPDL